MQELFILREQRPCKHIQSEREKVQRQIKDWRHDNKTCALAYTNNLDIVIISGMISTLEYFKVKNVDQDVAYILGSVPRVKKYYRQYTFYYCYYTPESYSMY